MFALRKKNKYIILFIMTIIISFSLLITYFVTNNYYNNIIKNSLSNRIITVYNNDIKPISKEELEQIKHVSKCYSLIQDISLRNTNNKVYTFTFIDYTEYSSLKNNEIIIPDSMKYNIGDNIKFYSDTNEYDLKVKDTYKESNLGFNYIIINKYTIEEIVEYSSNNYSIIIDNYDNTESVKQEIIKLGGEPFTKDQDSERKIKIFKYVLDLMTLAVVILIIFVIIIYIYIIKSIIKEQEMDIAVYKTCGYHTSQIIINIIKNLLKLIIPIFIIISIIIFIILLITNIFISTYITVLNLLFIALAVLIISVVLIIIICYIKSRSIDKISPIILFKDM